jgi:hypothetical protein
MQQFDREYCHDVKNACLQAIANTSFCERTDPLEIRCTATKGIDSELAKNLIR